MLEGEGRPNVHYVVSAVGAVGTGKSSLLNAIIDEYTFETGNGTDAKTDKVRGEVKEWALEWRVARKADRKSRESRYCHLIDTPGLIDSNIEDRQNIQEMITYFKSLENGVSAFFLVFNINDIRLDAYTQNMLSLFHQLLGEKFWNFVVIVFTHVDEDLQEDLEENIEAVTASDDGFVAEIRRLYKLPRSFQPSVIFTSTQNVRTNSYTQKRIRELYSAVGMCESRNDGKRFTCKWLKEIQLKLNQEEKANFIQQSIREALSSMTNTCLMQ
ncbi:P-loop containing nucleoside triphosphate hydrolase protein [Parasitella parasitica]|nr:P-loop containing nucleoside triphosphate hydrolase protein [Parasitella parasitica]